MDFRRQCCMMASGSNISADSLVPELSDSSVETPDTSVTLAQKRKRKRVNFTISETFGCKDDAEKFVQDEKCWAFRKRYNTEEGEKKIYRCNKVKARGQQCDANVYLLFDSVSSRVFLFRSDLNHNCDEIDSKSGPTLTPEVKQLIELLCDQKKTPLAIMDQIVLKKLPLPKLYQINNHLAKYKKDKFGPPAIKISDLRRLLDAYIEIPEATDAPYVVYNLDDTDGFKFFITSKALIAKARGAISLSADATYKLLWQGFPVLLVGTTDLNRKFHIIGVAVCQYEREADFRFMFQSVKHCAKLLLQEIVAPTTIVCDAANAISNAFEAEFGEDAEVTIIMCWTHMLKSTKKAVATHISDKTAQVKILEDVKFLQIIFNVPLFETALSLFLKKWSMWPDFIAYFTQEWITQNPNWFEGAMQRVPSTNNALEATNRVIKDQFTLRERLSLGEFLSVMEDMIGQFSRRCETDLTYAVEPTILFETWTAAHHWTNLNVPLIKKKQENGDTVIRLKSSSSTESAVIESNWQNFEEFRRFYLSHWYVTLASNETNWLKSSCSCPKFQKQFMCKHVVGIAVRQKQAVVPVEAKTVKIGEKRKRGRPAKAAKALIIQ